MDSSSSCTYYELIEDYRSTKDSTFWEPHFVTHNEINSIYGCPKIAVSLYDGVQLARTRRITTITSEEMEEMTAEPLLSTPEKCEVSLKSVLGDWKDSIPVAISTYGCKHLVFELPGCLLCIDETRQRLYCPHRLLKKVLLDCAIKGIQCQLKPSKSTDTYCALNMSPTLEDKCKNVSESCAFKRVTSNHKPMYTDGLTYYVPVQVAMVILLVRNRHTEVSDETNDTIIRKGKREINVIPLNVTVK